MEAPAHELSLTSDGTVVVVPTKAYEIKTVRVQFAGSAYTASYRPQ